MLDFGQRMGLKPASDVIQREGMDADLRNALWNCLQECLWSNNEILWGSSSGPSEATLIFRLVWKDFLKLPMDEVPEPASHALKEFRRIFFNATWYDVYGVVEYILQLNSSAKDRLRKHVDRALERFKSGFRLIDGQFAPITDPEEIREIENALANGRFRGASQHMQRSLQLYADINQHDYRNSIKESISAVESAAHELTGKSTLGDALKELEKKHALHPALKSGFLKLYGYTSDADGVRHAILDEAQDISEADARYMLVTCSAFVNYLKSTYA